MIKILVFCLICLVLIVFLRKVGPEYALITAVIAGAITIGLIIGAVYTPVTDLLGLLQEYGTPAYLTTYLLKCFGICLLTKFSGELCVDFGQSSLASKIELAGRSAILILSLPVIKTILNAGLGLL